LTAEDTVNFEAALAGLTRRVVGYYRSHNRDSLFLSVDDLHLIRRHFRGPENLFLLIKTLPNRACTAGFFFWKDGRIQAEFTDSEVPLIPVSVSCKGESSPPGENFDDIAAAPAAPVLPPANPQRNRDLRRLMRGMAVTGVAAAVTFSVVRYWETRAPEPVHGKDGTAVQVVPQEPAAPTAVRAPAEIVKQSGPNVQGRPPSSPKAALPQTQNQPSTPLRGQPESPTPAPAPLPTGEATAVHSPSPGQPSPPPSSSLPSVSMPASAPASIEPPPHTTPASPVEATIRPPAQMTPASVSENPVTPAIEVQRTDAVTRDVPPVATPAPAPPSASPAAHTFIGPQAIHQVTPPVPREVGPMITTDVQVDVAVAIDAKGKVTGARIASTKGAAAGLLTIEALKAAQLFRFQPAQEDGRKVTSSMVLTFRFAPTAK
jgi:TonB family protein